MRNSIALWDKMSKIYDRETSQLSLINKRAIEITKKYLHPDNRVLEIGCGTGIFTVELAGNVKEYIATDISSGMLETARRKAYQQKIKNIVFRQSTIFEEQYVSASCDVILAFNVLHYFEDFSRYMKRISELLKPGGLLISMTPCSRETEKPLLRLLKVPILRLFVFFKLGVISLPYIRFFRIAELDKAITEGGFRLVETENLWGPEVSYFIVAKKKYIE